MISTLDDAREVGALAARLAFYASKEGKSAIASCLAAISEAANRCSEVSDIPALGKELLDAYAALYAPKEEGLADFFRWDPDPEIRRRLNVEFEVARNRLDKLLGYSP